VAAQDQMARSAADKARVQETEEPERSYLKRDKSKGKRGGHLSGEEKKKKKKQEGIPPAATGKLLDTVA